MSEVIKTGPYGIVSLVERNVYTIEDTVARERGTGLRARLGRFLRGISNSSAEEIGTSAVLARHIVQERQVSTSEINAIPRGMGIKEDVKRANIFALVSYFHGNALSEQKMLGYRIPRGSVVANLLTDFLAILPQDMAARILLSASNPSVARTVMNNEGTLNLEGHDTQQIAVETLILSPVDLRHTFFKEMAKISPGEEGEAFKLFKLIVSTMPNIYSEFSAFRIIGNHLKGDAADKKREEIQEDFTTNLRPLILQQKPSKV